jgi:hypothetical protein
MITFLISWRPFFLVTDLGKVFPWAENILALLDAEAGSRSTTTGR